MDNAFHYGAGARVREVTDTSGNRRKAEQEKWCAKTEDKDDEWTWTPPCPTPWHPQTAKARNCKAKMSGAEWLRRALMKDCLFLYHMETLFSCFVVIWVGTEIRSHSVAQDDLEITTILLKLRSQKCVIMPCSYLCLCVHMCTCMCSYACTCVPMPVEVRDWSWVCSSVTLHLLLWDKVCHWTWSLPIQWSLLANEL